MMKTSPHKIITSKENSIIKHLRGLSEPKNRKKERSFLIEGIKIVEEALRDNLGVKSIVAAPDLVQHHGKQILELASKRAIDVVWVSRHLLDAISESKTPQPVLAVVEMKKYDAASLLAHPSRLIVMADQLQDPGNLGTIIRTTEAAGASGVAVTSRTVDAYNQKAIRASMGSILRVPVTSVSGEFLKDCKARGFQTIATVLNGEKAHYDIDLTKPSVIVVGQEGAGLSKELMTDIDLRVRIPLAETIDSLNVAVATAVVLYEAVRQRRSTAPSR